MDERSQTNANEPLRDAVPGNPNPSSLYQGEVKSPPSWMLDEMRAKQRAHEQQSTANLCVRPSLRERVNGAFYRAERETRNVSRLKELADLLDSNPAIARILELIEATGV